MSVKKLAIIILSIAASVILWAAGVMFFPVLFQLTAKVEIHEDPAEYEAYLAGADHNGKNRWHKWDMDESIWPAEISDTMDVIEYKMIRYDPWDAQFLGYLVIEYPPEEYAAEMGRLRNYPSTDYQGIYSVGEETTYELAAVNADPYHGFVYALTDGNNRIIYAEEIFCNYVLDLDYTEYIPEEYLLDGFNARSGNPYRKKMMHK